ncbi:MAG: DUF805 domain-containing protein [Novosphingobium sp.]
MLDNLKFHLQSLLVFSGREPRRVFWPWVAAVMVLNMATAMIAIVPIFVTAFTAINRFAREHPDQATVTSGPGSYSVQVHGNHPEFMPDFGGFMMVSAIAALVTVLLLAAAVARRLHDCGRSALLGLLPVPFLTVGMVMMPVLFGQALRGGEPDMGLFLLLFGNNLAYLTMLGVLIALTAGKSTPGENRFGPPLASDE